MRPTVAMALVWAVPLIAQEPPQILQIYRDPLTQGREAAYKAVEQEAARICARLSFPHPHLAMESLTGPKEVWWLNAFASEAERQGVSSDYAKNPALVAALEGIGRRKEGLITGRRIDDLQSRSERRCLQGARGCALFRRDGHPAGSPDEGLDV